MPPRRSKGPAKGKMSVEAPFEVAPALGGFRTTAFNQAIRVCAQLLADAAVDAAEKFTADEWWVLAESYQDRAIEPENPTPGYVMARLVERANSLYRVTARLGDKADKAVGSIVRRLEHLSYINAWGVLIACQFYWEYRSEIEDGDRWWEIPYRREKIKPRQQNNGG